MKELKVKCWIEIEGEKLFGPGPSKLLELIDQEGSISGAAKLMGMSYKKAWDLINKLNEKCSEPVVIRQTGGAKGGGALLTDKGRLLIEQYHLLEKKLEQFSVENQCILEMI